MRHWLGMDVFSACLLYTSKDKSSFILSPVSKTGLLLSGYHKVNEFL